MNSRIATALTLLLGALLISGAAWAQQPAAAPPTATQEAPLTNADVVKLCKLDLGDEVVIAKINQAREVAFQLDSDSLISLKQQGVSKPVIEAMLKRTAPSQRQSPTAAQGAARAGATVAGDEGVWLQSSTGTVQLQSVLGDLSATYAAVTYLLFLDFPGLRADLRISDRKPVLLVRMAKSPRGRIFLVKCERDEDDNVRSVKVGKAGLFGMKSWNSPDEDWTVEFDLSEAGQGTWQITPKTDLAPGEYGLLFRGGFGGALGAQQADLFDFGVD